jgi:hypothetical protein
MAKLLSVPAALICVALATDCPAQDKSITVKGVLDCGTWNRARTNIRSSNVLEGFLQGLMNGLAMGSGTEFWNARGNGIKEEQVFLWMDTFCGQNPLSSVIEGAITLMNEQTGGAYFRSLERR